MAQLCIALIYVVGLGLLGLQALYLYQTRHISIRTSHSTNATFILPGIVLEAVESLQSTRAILGAAEEESVDKAGSELLSDLFADGEVNAHLFSLEDTPQASEPEESFMLSEQLEDLSNTTDSALLDTSAKGESNEELSRTVAVDVPEAEAAVTRVVTKVGGAEYNAVFDGVEMELTKQLVLPKRPLYQKYNIEANFWPVTKYLKKKGWAFGANVPMNKVSLVFTRGKVPSGHGRGRQMLNSIGLSGCIGGSKKLQLECRQRLAQHYGCKYDTLGIQVSLECLV